MLGGALGEFSASCAYKHILGMSSVFSKEITWKQIDIVTAFGAGMRFNPKEVFHGGCHRTAEKALRSI
jgi:hypothetical protein